MDKIKYLPFQKLNASISDSSFLSEKSSLITKSPNCVYPDATHLPHLNIATDDLRVFSDAGGGLGQWWVLPLVEIAVKIYNFSNYLT